MAKPIAKWAGGKRQLVEQLLRLAPPDAFQEGPTYHEPMLGGGALFFCTEPRKAILSDLNPDLIFMYEMVRDRPAAVIEHLNRLRAEHHKDEKETYYAVREEYNAGSMGERRAAQFLYLNKTCFNGLYRVNKKGHFNVPLGSYKNPSIYNSADLINASILLRRAQLYRESFENSAGRANSGDFVYFDPPYVPVSKTSDFTAFTAKGFGENDQRQLARTVEGLVERGVRVMVSNSDHPFVHGLYKDYPRTRVWARRSINSKATGRGHVSELVVLAGYDPPNGTDLVTEKDYL